MITQSIYFLTVPDDHTVVYAYTAQSSTDVSAVSVRFSISVYLSTRHAKLKSVVIGVSKDSHSATSMRATYKWRQFFMESRVSVSHTS